MMWTDTEVKKQRTKQKPKEQQQQKHTKKNPKTNKHRNINVKSVHETINIFSLLYWNQCLISPVDHIHFPLIA